ncbi:hypothetical protein HKX48_008755 [Thoreauomyces humboldtii]|nr:hypothetical protein HKX48_008755 [Thoreauomyces humboldtii]
MAKMTAQFSRLSPSPTVGVGNGPEDARSDFKLASKLEHLALSTPPAFPSRPTPTVLRMRRFVRPPSAVGKRKNIEDQEASRFVRARSAPPAAEGPAEEVEDFGRWQRSAVGPSGRRVEQGPETVSHNLPGRLSTALLLQARTDPDVCISGHILHVDADVATLAENLRLASRSI